MEWVCQRGFGYAEENNNRGGQGAKLPVCCFFDFKKRVLEPARLELLEKTGKSFTWEPIKQGRGGKIVSIQILFDEDEEPGTGSVPAMTASGPAVVQPTVNLSEPLQTILNGLLAFGIAPKTARELVENYDPDRILEAVSLTQQQKNLQNQAGFLINAIRGDWHDPRLEKLRQQRQRRKEKDDLEARKSKLTQLKLALFSYRSAVAIERYNAASDAQKQQWKSQLPRPEGRGLWWIKLQVWVDQPKP